MSEDRLFLSSTTDGQAQVSAAVRNDAEHARVEAPVPESRQLDGSQVIVVEDENSSRKQLERLLAEAEELTNPDADSGLRVETNAEESEEDESEAVVPGEPASLLPSDHPHWQRQREAEEFFGRERVAQIASDYLAAGVDLLPGLCRQLAEYKNSPQVVLALMREPAVIQHLNEVALISPAQAEEKLEQISRFVAGETAVENQEQEVRKSKVPPPIRPIGGSSTKSSVPDDQLPFREYCKKREREIKNKYRR